MKLTSLFLCTLIVAGCGVSQSSTASASHHAAQVKLPEFVDEAPDGINEDIAAPRQKLVFYRNYDAIREILKHDSSVVRQEMEKRLVPSQPISLQLLAATVLVLKNDDLGRQFFITRSRIPANVGDLFVAFFNLTVSSPYLTGSEADFSWAEDMMIDALQDRTRVNWPDALDTPRNIRRTDDTVEIRQLAIEYGGFSTQLLKMRSEKALPVVLALLREYPYYRLNACIGYLGNYNDDRVKSLVLDFLKRHQHRENADTYRFAVSAASDLGLKAAVPILLQHLDDDDSYPGLRVLADRSVIPVIEAALPRLRSYARAEAELSLILMKGGDVTPALLRLVERRDFLKRNDVMSRLLELRDARSVPTMTMMLCHDPNWSVRSMSIEVLAAVKNKDAVSGLVNGLGCDYSKLERGKTNRDHDFNREYRDEIAKALKRITKEDFGVDQKRWLLWLDHQ